MASANLRKARAVKNDEFYTQLTDVSKELIHYKQHFKNKIVYCNCDDPKWSAFWEYFHRNFSSLGLKKLISTHYDREEATYEMEYTGGDDNNIDAGVITPLEGNGDFRNQECLDLLDEADIVVTNPPFSLFREYVAQLMEYDEKFLIIGNVNAITYKEIFPLIKANSLWVGYKFNGKPMEFIVPDDYPLRGTVCGYMPDGRKYVGVGGTCWYTNLDIKKRHEDLFLSATYYKKDGSVPQASLERWPHYDNYDAIEVSKTKDIPVDYTGVMGVPITFLDKYNPEQFEIIGLDRYTVPKKDLVGGRVAINGKPCYARILIRARHPAGAPVVFDEYE